MSALFFGMALLLGLVAGSTSHADETPARVFHIGIFSGTLRSHPSHVAFEDRLRELGYVEGRNLTFSGRSISTRWQKVISPVLPIRAAT